MENALITISNCSIENSKETILSNLNWCMKHGEAWLVIGPNGGGKADFVKALSGELKLSPYGDGLYSNVFKDSTEIVSLERAAKIIQEERENDESEYIEGGVDIGRTGRIFIGEALFGKIKKNAPLPPEVQQLEKYPEIKLCGVENILDRGLKYMSTGEIRRTLLARALISKKKLLILSDPFAGLDVQSRKILLEFFTQITKKQLSGDKSSDFPHIIIGMERWHEIPDSITHVLEFTNKEISFCGKRNDYENLLLEKKNQNEKTSAEQKNQLNNAVEETWKETAIVSEKKDSEEKIPLVEMSHVNVGWGDKKVLVDLNWTLNKGEHWLIQGPNGSGKTTFLELITGDNMQVYCNDIKLFGKKRGSGESIWDIKKRLGIVSYRLHVEYRMVGSTSLRDVIISGFRDSIGLYEAATDVEISLAKKWLKLGGFEGRESESFNSLSYGEQRALLILRSAVKSPEILILDEPCHGLDEQYREKILNLMELIGNGNTTTMLHVTHDSSEILACEKHVLELLPGQSPMYCIKEK